MPMLRLPTAPRRRRPSLTPMIDVVFLLLIFFMVVARFGGTDGISLLLSSPAGEAAPYSGPPRLVTVLPEGVALNGRPVEDLPAALAPLMSAPSDLVVLRPAPGVSTGRLVDVLSGLQGAGLTQLSVVE